MVVNNVKFVQAQTFQLAGAGVSAGDSSMTLTSFNQIDGTALTMSNFGIVGYGTVEPASGVYEEQISFTGITANADGTKTLTGIKTVITIFPYTETANFATGHAGGTAFVISNTAGYYNTFANKNDDASIIAKWIFLTAQRPELTADTDSVVATELVTFGQLARTAISGGVNASTTVQGLVQLATQAQYDAKTLTGSTGAKLVATPDLNRATKYNDGVADTGSATAYAIAPSPAITAYAAYQQFTFIAANTNTTTTPTLAVSGLASPKTIKRANGTALAVGDIQINGMYSVIYNGTDFLLNTSTVPTTYSIVTATKDAADASAVQNIAHGLGKIPRYVKITATFPIASVSTTNFFVWQAVAEYNGTTQASVSTHRISGGAYKANVATFSINSADTDTSSDGVITWDATNIIITWTKVGTPAGVFNLIVESQA